MHLCSQDKHTPSTDFVQNAVTVEPAKLRSKYRADVSQVTDGSVVRSSRVDSEWMDAHLTRFCDALSPSTSPGV